MTDINNLLHEVCASAEADFDEAGNRLTVRLDSFVRTTDPREPERQFKPDWLPRSQEVTEGVSREEGIDLAKDIFKGWVRRVRECTPSHSPE